MNRPIALLTDFGSSDHYAGSIKSVILSINPKAVIFDITHEIRPHHVREGAYILNAVFRFLPKNCIVVGVVDPEVGSDRTALCIKATDRFFLGPDNGLFSLALKDQSFETRRITNDRFFLKPVSSTFHGRDIFSPCAAQLSTKNIFTDFGPLVTDIKHLNFSSPRKSENKISGEIVYVDRFGNAMTNISKGSSSNISVKFSGRQVPLKPFFSAGRPGELIALWNSGQILELAVYNDSAERIHHLKIGDLVEVFES